MAKDQFGISFKTGTSVYSRNFTDPNDAFKAMQGTLKALKKNLGELTRPFDELAGILIPIIKQRFNTDELSDKPYRKTNYPRSRFTRNARRARRTNPDGATLNSSGRLRDSVRRLPSATKSSEGGQREVNKMAIGYDGSAPYFRTQTLGGVFEVPVRLGRRGGKHFDPDRLENSLMTSEQYWGKKRWAQYSSLPEGIVSVSVPATNPFVMRGPEQQIISTVLVSFLQKVMRDAESQGAGI